MHETIQLPQVIEAAFQNQAPEHRQSQVFRAPMWIDRPGPRKTAQSPPERT